MTIKERPLINAVSKLGPFPSPNHPVLSGMYATVVAGLFGAFAMFFQIFGRGGVVPLDIYLAVRTGAWLGFAVAAVCLLLLLVLSPREEARTTIPFVLSGLVTIAVLVGIEFAFADHAYAWLQRVGPLIDPQPRW